MGRKKGKGRAVKRARQKFGAHFESEEIKNAPHSMVINRGQVDKNVRELIQDVRKVMQPYTAAELKATKKNSLKDFVAIAGPLHVSHLIVFTQTELADNMKIMRLPRGPSLHFRLVEYCLSNDVLNVQKKRHTHQKQFLYQPLLILNGFNVDKTSQGDEQKAADSAKPEFHLKLLATTLQNMFPSINITKIKLNEIRRCVLFNYNKEDKTIDFRQYYVRLMPVGLSKPVKKLVQEKVPDLSNFQDISEFIENGGNLSESEAEFDAPESQVKVSQEIKIRHAVNLKNTTSAIRLYEIGPRLKLKLIKIEEGLCDGEVLYHELIQKTPEELSALRESLKLKKKKEKEMKKLNEKNEAKRRTDNKRSGKNKKDNSDSGVDEEEEDEEDDLDYYKREVGEEPDANMFKRKSPKSKEKEDDYLKRVEKRVRREMEDDDGDKGSDSDSEHRPPPNKKFVKFANKNDQNGAGKKRPPPAKAKFLGFSKKKKAQFNKAK